MDAATHGTAIPRSFAGLSLELDGFASTQLYAYQQAQAAVLGKTYNLSALLDTPGYITLLKLLANSNANGPFVLRLGVLPAYYRLDPPLCMRQNRQDSSLLNQDHHRVTITHVRAGGNTEDMVRKGIRSATAKTMAALHRSFGIRYIMGLNFLSVSCTNYCPVRFEIVVSCRLVLA